MKKSTHRNIRKLFVLSMVGVFIFTITGSSWSSAFAQDIPTDAANPETDATETSTIEVISPYFSIEHRSLADGTQIDGYIINGPPDPPAEFEAERAASILPLPSRGTLASFPSYDWVFGCSAVSGAMIAAYYDNNGYPNMYSGPTNGGVMPLTDTSWATWVDGASVTYPNNPLIASHNGVDGRVTRGSIDDYWVSYGSAANDPYITGTWTQHAWGNAIGDYMKTSQSAYSNTDGSSSFWTYDSSAAKLTCSDMVGFGISSMDGTYGRKLFYEARGYSVGECYNQKTDNNAGGFTLANFQAEIDAGHPVLLNLEGHSIVGYGYTGSTIYVRDTWDNNPANTYTMTWGGSYSTMPLRSVSVVHLNPMVQYKSFLPFIVNDTGVVIPPDPILNGDFESGQVSWTESSYQGWDLILNSSEIPITPHSGSWAVWLGRDDSEISELSQAVAIPIGRSILHFWYWIYSDDSCGYDFFNVNVNGTAVLTWDLCSSTNTGGWVEHAIDLSAHAGGASENIMFEVITDYSVNSYFFLDDVSLETSLRTSETTYFSGIDAGSTRCR